MMTAANEIGPPMPVRLSRRVRCMSIANVRSSELASGSKDLPCAFVGGSLKSCCWLWFDSLMTHYSRREHPRIVVVGEMGVWISLKARKPGLRGGS